MFGIIAAVAAGAVAGRVGVGRLLKGAIGVARGAVNVTLNLAEGLVDQAVTLAQKAQDETVSAVERAKARVELEQLLRDNPELAKELALAEAEEDETTVSGR